MARKTVGSLARPGSRFPEKCLERCRFRAVFDQFVPFSVRRRLIVAPSRTRRNDMPRNRLQRFASSGLPHISRFGFTHSDHRNQLSMRQRFAQPIWKILIERIGSNFLAIFLGLGSVVDRRSFCNWSSDELAHGTAAGAVPQVLSRKSRSFLTQRRKVANWHGDRSL
jgi:hypothetical protein